MNERKQDCMSAHTNTLSLHSVRRREVIILRIEKEKKKKRLSALTATSAKYRITLGSKFDTQTHTQKRKTEKKNRNL